MKSLEEIRDILAKLQYWYVNEECHPNKEKYAKVLELIKLCDDATLNEIETILSPFRELDEELNKIQESIDQVNSIIKNIKQLIKEV